MEERLSKLELEVSQIISGLGLEKIVKSTLDSLLDGTLTISCIKQEIQRRYRLLKTDIDQQQAESRRLESLIKESQQKIAENSKKINQLKEKISQQAFEVEKRAFTEQVRALQKENSLKCPLSYVYEIEADIKSIVKNEQFRALIKKFEAFREEAYKQFFLKDQADKEFSRIQGSFLDLFQNYGTKQDLQSLSSKFFKKISLMNSSIDEFQGEYKQQFAHITQTVHSIKKQLERKVSTKQFTDLSKQITDKATKDDLDRLYRNINPKFSGFQKELAVFNRLLQEQQQLLLKQDENLLQKANKQEFDLLTSKIEKVLQHVEIQDKIDAMLESISTLQSDFQFMESSIRRVQQQTMEMMSFYTRKYNEAKQIKCLKDAVVGMQTVISYKADRSETLNYLEQKAGWNDFQYLTNAIDEVHKQTKLVVVQLGAMQRIVADPYKARGPERAQREYLSKITQKIQNFIVTSKPTQHGGSVPDDLQAFMSLPDFLRAGDFGLANKPQSATPKRPNSSRKESNN